MIEKNMVNLEVVINQLVGVFYQKETAVELPVGVEEGYAMNIINLLYCLTKG